MKVLMISTDWRIAVLGSREHARMQSYASVTEELHIIVFTQKNQGLAISSADNLFIYPTNSLSRWSYGIGAYFISERLKKIGITMVTAQDPFETGLVAYKISKKFSVSLQLQVHTDFLSPYYATESSKNRLRVKIADRIIPKANCLRVVSVRLQKGLMERYGLKKEPLVLPIHHGIPVSLLSIRRDLLKTKYPQFAKIAVMISRLETEKNIFMALNAFKNISNKYRGVGLVIVGDGSMRAQLEKAVIALELEDEVVFDGWHEDAIPYFLSADLFLNVSNYEGYGRTLIEAAASGCPIVTTNVGVVGEAINSENALISPPQDLEAFQNNFEYALNHPEAMKELAIKARQAVASEIAVSESDRLAIIKSSWEKCSKK
ncbi:MAG: glycosyltransferase family 4 protein [bacterium]|nr:glycosyltransferase family 4 protein [bacterium]